MKRALLLAALLGGVFILPSCGVAEGLAKAVGRSGGSVSRSVSNLGSSISR